MMAVRGPLLASLLIVVITRAAGAATAALRFTPRALDQPYHEDVEGNADILGAVDEDLDLSVLHQMEALDEDTMDVLVPPDIWSLGALRLAEEDVLQMRLSPQQRLYLSSLTSSLPHFNTSCSCERWKCSCCAGVGIASLRKNKTGCTSLAFVKERIAIVFALSFNNRTLLERELISGSNPPPFCFPLPQLPVITFCLRFSNISLTDDDRVQACAAVEAGLVFTSSLIRIRFGCVKIGSGGVSWSSMPSAIPSTFIIPTVNDNQSALQQFATALNTTDNEQFNLLQSFLRQQASTVLPTRKQKMAWSSNN